MSFKTFIRQKVFDLYRFSYKWRIGYIRTRTELPAILNSQKLCNSGVEVGVWKGEFSKILLDNWQGKKLFLVDPWRTFADDIYIDDMNISQSQFDFIHDNVKNTVEKNYKGKAEIIRDLSTNASNLFEIESLDFVYLDGRHDYYGVKEDIDSWYNKIKAGGILCGHDYLDTTIGKTVFGVKKAVDEFALSMNLKVLITDKDSYPSWFIIKPKS